MRHGAVLPHLIQWGHSGDDLLPFWDLRFRAKLHSNITAPPQKAGSGCAMADVDPGAISWGHVNLITTSPRAWCSRLSHPPSSTRLLRRRPSGIAGIGVAVAQHDAALTLEDFVATFYGPLAVEYAGLVVVVGPFQAGVTAGQLHGGCGAARSQSQRDQCDSGDQIGTAQQGKHGD